MGATTKSGRGGDRDDPPQRAIRTLQPQPRTQTPDEHGDVGALSSVVGVELIEHQILQGGRRVVPQAGVRLAQQEQIEHPVVGEQDVGWVVTQCVPVIDQRMGAGMPSFTLAAYVDTGTHAGEALVPMQIIGKATGLIGDEGVHRVQDDRLDPPLAAGRGSLTVIQERNEKGLRLSRSGAGRDDRRLGRLAVRGESRERLGLVLEGPKSGRHPVQR